MPAPHDSFQYPSPRRPSWLVDIGFLVWISALVGFIFYSQDSHYPYQTKRANEVLSMVYGPALQESHITEIRYQFGRDWTPESLSGSLVVYYGAMGKQGRIVSEQYLGPFSFRIRVNADLVTYGSKRNDKAIGQHFKYGAAAIDTALVLKKADATFFPILDDKIIK